MVLKYLNPQHVIVTRGFDTIDPTIVVRITDIAILEVAKCLDNVSVMQKLNGISKLFLAPEL